MSAETKEQLRKQLMLDRKNTNAADFAVYDAAIASAVKNLPAFKNAPVVLTYLSFGKEVDTRALIEEARIQGKQVALPKCQAGGQMGWHLVDSLDGLVISSFGIYEPDEAIHPAVDISDLPSNVIALVPGLAFDEQGYRIGYGGGYYDRFLASFPGTSIGLCRPTSFYGSLQEFDIVEPHDIPVNIVVTGE